VSSHRETIYPPVEGAIIRYILVDLRPWLFLKPSRVRDNLSNLPPGDVVEGLEGPIRVAPDDTSAG
jgi:hypothetical protein